MGWLDWAIDDPAPGNCGYGLFNIPCEVDRSLRYGMTIHGAWGYWPGDTLPSSTMRAMGNSWGVTVKRDGRVYRHRPRPTFVNWHGGGPAQNIGTEAIEAEGKEELWTPPQRASILRVCVETWDWFGWGDVVLGGPTDKTQDGIRHALLMAGHGSIWEHNWFDWTDCPVGRNENEWLIARMKEGIVPGFSLNSPIVGMERHPKGNGYWLVASDGGVFAFGVPFYGSAGDIALNQPIVGMAATKSGKGYWLVASDGGIFCYGDAHFYGTAATERLVAPIVGMEATRSGRGYWLVASDGGIFAYGDAPFHGSVAALRTAQQAKERKR